MNLSNKPVVLIVIDGFGITQPIDSNAITEAKTPYLDNIAQNFPTMLLNASGLSVGLPWGEVGNSEVGHVNIGSGTLIYQSLPRINISIDNKNFFKEPELISAVEKVKTNKSNLHIMGLLGLGGVHSHLKHLEALVDLCKKHRLKKNVYFHLFLDGRDAPKDSGLQYLKQFLDYKKKIGKIATITGRFYAMDRNNAWDRTKKAYDAICCGIAEKTFNDPLDAIEDSYKNNIFDETFEPVIIAPKKNGETLKINKEDAVIFFNFRADRARQLTEAFVDPNFKRFDREFIDGLTFVCFTEYKKNMPNAQVVFPPKIIKNPLAKVFSDNNFKQLHIAETEKYAHVTFFLNGQTEKAFPNEDRILIDSPSVLSYDEKPEMSLPKVCEEVKNAILSDKYDFIAINFANPDMVGHTGNLKASIEAIEFVDKCLGKILDLIKKKNGICFIVGDHGNAEELVNLKTLQPDKEHSIYPVPFITVSEKHYGKFSSKFILNDLYLLQPVGMLADVAPTILSTIGLPLPPEMDGTNLLG